jgi:hypothetical protein
MAYEDEFFTLASDDENLEENDADELYANDDEDIDDEDFDDEFNDN